jgi:hypothetical protein
MRDMRAKGPSGLSSQVVSFGALGILGRTGWYCHESDVERWNALAGYRGLEDPAVQRHFNGTFLAFEKDWGGNEELRMSKLGLRYDVVYLGAGTAADTIRERLDARVPTLFYLWSPHPFNKEYSLNRIQLPAYSPALFEQGVSDYPLDVVEKVAAKQLADAEAAAQLYSRFQISNFVQETILANIDIGGQSAMGAVCSWMRQEENVAVWQAWVPLEKLTCDVGHYAVNGTSCAPCPPGSASVGGTATACVQCSAGAAPPSPPVAWSHSDWHDASRHNRVLRQQVGAVFVHRLR